ncbi:hypothetical protein HanXRQr2_Chr17g0827951 [Helianthus annuus]|uniref:Uncharacterized protein n=1 Tax=Helianthus annuus TaxID=4232 RepID=A0A251RU51_HELAN|nr:hypothetical protein HanXRQr2_Chr17g0827951 [Helianthus annuus]
MVESTSSPVPGMTDEQYAMFLKLFGGNKNQEKEEPSPSANMAGLEQEELDWSG